MTTIAPAKQGKLSPRVAREKEDLLSAIPQIDTERIEVLLDVYRNDGVDPNIIRRAKLFNRLCNQKTIFIDGNPIVGTLTRHKYGAVIFPEEGCVWMERTDSFYLERGKAEVTPEVREWITKALALWRRENLFNASRDIMLKQLKVDPRIMGKTGLWSEITPHGARHMIFADFDQAIKKGLKGVLADVDAAEAKLDAGEEGALDKYYFYEAARLVLNGMMTLAQRYAALARDMAKKEPDPARKAELEEIAGVCDRVPANPARNFREALQAYWFTMLGIWLEAPGVLNNPPVTFCRCLYPYYKQDKEKGQITTEEAIELIQFFFLQCNRLATILPPHGFRFSQTRLGLQLGLGGFTADGGDASNELDYLVLEAQRQAMMPEPLVNIVYHDKLPDELLMKCIELIRTGIGQPAFHNGRIAVERHLYHNKAPLDLARKFGIGGCVQSALPGYMNGYWYIRLSVAKMVELVMNNGKDPLTGILLGPQTGDPETFKTYGEFYNALVAQLKYHIQLAHDASRIVWNVQRNFPTPFGSMFVHDCIEKGKDVSHGGARYSFGDGVCMVGGIDTANSLAAIKKLVFDDKKVTMARMKKALAADFVGYEELQKMCLDAPKYGNDDEYADSIAKDLYDVCFELTPKVDHLGQPTMPSAYSVAAHTAHGEYTGALPDGRKARSALTDASVSATPGTDRSGPTALVHSAAKVLDGVKYSSTHFNMKFHPTALKDQASARKLLSLIKTYFDLGGYHVQFNCVSSETLKEAQAHPQDYKQLIVRVAGFSAYFIHLDKDLQDEIIKRTELKL